VSRGEAEKRGGEVETTDGEQCSGAGRSGAHLSILNNECRRGAGKSCPITRGSRRMGASFHLIVDYSQVKVFSRASGKNENC